jgi:hypothetical protein
LQRGFDCLLEGLSLLSDSQVMIRFGGTIDRGTYLQVRTSRPIEAHLSTVNILYSFLSWVLSLKVLAVIQSSLIKTLLMQGLGLIVSGVIFL